MTKSEASVNAPQDPRRLNQTFNPETVRTYFLDYIDSLHKCLAAISPDSLEKACQLLLKTRENGGRIFAAGNGGSAAISEHLSCDWQKGVHIAQHKCLKVHCLTSNSSLLTAISNDFGYDKSFAFQLEMADLESRDVLLLISSSGNSENIIRAAQLAKEKGAQIIGLSGFKGGRLNEIADVSIYAPFENYGLVEDAHQVVMHVLAQYHDLIYKKRSSQP